MLNKKSDPNHLSERLLYGYYFLNLSQADDTVFLNGTQLIPRATINSILLLLPYMHTFV